MSIIKIMQSLQHTICTIVHGKTLDEFISNLQKAQKLTDWVELRIDSLEQVSIFDIEKIFSIVQVKSIVTCRTPKNRGEFTQSEQVRIQLFEKAISEGCTFIDVEFGTRALTFFTDYKEIQSRLIISYHNFIETPSSHMLWRIRNDMVKLKPAVIKVCTMTHTEADVQKLLYLVALRKNTDPQQIIIGMGKHGRALRLCGPMFGTFLSFAKLNNTKSSSGKLSADQMKKMYKIIEEVIQD